MQVLSNKNIPELDGLRGLAIFLVFLTHNFGRSIPFAWVGVDLFFVLSGYLITGILLDYKGHPNYFRAFFGRRILRIFPLYYAFLFIFFAIVPITSTDFSYYQNNQGWFWLYFQNWLFSLTGFPSENYVLTHFWSLAVEEQFYLFWPILVYITPKRKFVYLVLILTLISIGSRFASFQTFHWEFRYISTISRTETLVMGALISYLARYKLKYLPYVGIYGTGIGFTGIIILWITAGSFSYHEFMITKIGYSFVALFFSGLLVLILLKRFAALNQIFSNRFLLHLGKYSYGIYVFHWPIIYIFNEHVTFDSEILRSIPLIFIKIFSFCIVAILSLFLSWLSFHGLEQHFLKLKKYFPYENPAKIRQEIPAKLRFKSSKVQNNHSHNRQ